MRRDTPTFVCDATGCKSTCTLSPTSDDLPTDLTLRGWLVISRPENVGCCKTYCPGCKARIDREAKEPTDVE